MAINNNYEIIFDSDLLSEKHLPPTILSRKSHLNELNRYVSPVFKDQKPLSVWMHGSPGTGKTTVACQVLSEISKKTNAPGIYVNCWKYNTFYSVLEYMVNELRRGFGDARDTTVKLAQLERLLKDKPCLIVLDEIDLVNSNERNDMIYNLFSIGKVGLICISESRSPILSLENRIKSRLNPQILSFEPYSTEEIVEILENRAAQALNPGSWCPKILHMISKKANGDARIAIQTLRNAAIHADSDGAKRINSKYVKKGFSDTGGLRRTYELKRLTNHHRLLFILIKDNPDITSPELFQEYIKECGKINWKPVASRTFSLYTKKMNELRIIKTERARVKGRVHSFRIVT